MSSTMKNPTEVSGPLVFFKIKHNAGLELTTNRLSSPETQHVPKFMPRIFNLQNNHAST